MQLSYVLRLVCLLLFSVGLIQLLLTPLVRLLSPALEAFIATRTSRWQERLWFAVPLLPSAIALLIAIAAAGPSYLLHETNPGSEYVGWACVAGAALVCIHYASIALRCLHLAYAMHAASRASTANSRVAVSHRATPLLAVTGLFRAHIAASPQALSGEVFSDESLAVALAHEESHLRQRDNLKLLLLSSLSRKGRTGENVQRWRRAAERAADDDAVAGSRPRAILLAEALTAAARAVSNNAPTILAMELLPYECELEDRVNRLLDGETTQPTTRNFNVLPVGILLLAIATLALLPATQEFAEFVLHLG